MTEFEAQGEVEQVGLEHEEAKKEEEGAGGGETEDRWEVPGRTRCKAILRTGRRCRLPTVRGTQVCHKHGGLTPRGIASPHFKHGRYSKYMPVGLAEAYRRAIHDPDLLILSSEIALLDARTLEILQRIRTGEGRRAWEELKAVAASARAARERGDNPELIRLLLQILDKVEDYTDSESDLWEEVYQLVEQRRRLVESERKRMVELKQFLTLDQAANLMNALAMVVKQNVSDPVALRRIADAFAGYFGFAGSTKALGRGDGEGRPFRAIAGEDTGGSDGLSDIL